MVEQKESRTASPPENSHAPSDTSSVPVADEESAPVEENAGDNTILTSEPLLGVQDSDTDNG
jgi:hypothetical protein